MSPKPYGTAWQLISLQMYGVSGHQWWLNPLLYAGHLIWAPVWLSLSFLHSSWEKWTQIMSGQSSLEHLWTRLLSKQSVTFRLVCPDFHCPLSVLTALTPSCFCSFYSLKLTFPPVLLSFSFCQDDQTERAVALGFCPQLHTFHAKKTTAFSITKIKKKNTALWVKVS